MYIPIPQSEDELVRLVRSVGIDPCTWIKPPRALLSELSDGDAHLEWHGCTIATVRKSVLVDVNYLTSMLEWLEMYEAYQLILQSDGSYVRIDRTEDLNERLRETVRIAHGESYEDAVERLLREEAGFKRVDRSRLVRMNHAVEVVVTKKSRVYLGLMSKRLYAEFEYPVPNEDYDPRGNVESDIEKGVVSVFPWRRKSQRRLSFREPSEEADGRFLYATVVRQVVSRYATGQGHPPREQKMPQEEKPTLFEIETAHARGFRPVFVLNRTHVYARVLRMKDQQVIVDFLPAEELRKASPVPHGASMRLWWEDDLYAVRLRELMRRSGSLDEPHSFRTNPKRKFVQTS